jgi:hypothetical protein
MVTFFLQALLSVFSFKPLWNSISALVGTESLSNTMFNHVTYNILRYKSSGIYDVYDNNSNNSTPSC